MTPELLTWLIPLPPILAFAVIVLLTHRSNRLSHTLAVGAMFVSWGLAMTVFWAAITTPELGQRPGRVFFANSIGYHTSGNPRDPAARAGLPPQKGGMEPMYARFFAFISL